MDSVIRITVIFVFVTVSLRILGKRELGEMSPFELVMIMLIPEIVSESLANGDHSLTHGIIGVSTLLVLVLINSFLSYKFKTYKKGIEGEPVVLFYQGNFVQGALDRERINVDEILSEIRAKGFERFNQMKWVVLEPDGKISCIPYEHGERTFTENKSIEE